MNFNLSRALSIANKEIMHILRDPFTLIIALGLPIILVTFFGFAINFEIEDVKLNVSDLSQSRASRQLLEVFNASGYFNVVNPTDYGNLLKDVTAERVAGSIYIKPDFSKKINAGKTSEIQIILDGTDNSKAGTILTYLPGIEKAAIQKITGKTVKVPIKIHTRFLYNQELNSRWFMVPGITVLVIGLLSILLTALTI